MDSITSCGRSLTCIPTIWVRIIPILIGCCLVVIRFGVLVSREVGSIRYFLDKVLIAVKLPMRRVCLLYVWMRQRRRYCPPYCEILMLYLCVKLNWQRHSIPLQARRCMWCAIQYCYWGKRSGRKGVCQFWQNVLMCFVIICCNQRSVRNKLVKLVES